MADGTGVVETTGTGRQDVNIDKVAEHGAQAGTEGGTQTPEGESKSGAGNSQSDGDNTGGTGTENSGSDSEGDGADTYAPDADGKYTHPETKAKVEAPEMIKFLKEKFGASTAGAQALLTENTTVKNERDTLAGKITTLEKEMADLRTVAEGKNPEGVAALDAQAQLKTMSEQLALLKESSALDSFERTVPLATGELRESLKNLARANPNTPLQELWDKNLKAGAEAAEAKRKEDDDKRKKGAGDQGKGTSTREPAGGGNTVKGTKGDTGLTLDEFNALPVAKRALLIEKHGIA